MLPAYPQIVTLDAGQGQIDLSHEYIWFIVAEGVADGGGGCSSGYDVNSPPSPNWPNVYNWGDKGEDTWIEPVSGPAFALDPGRRTAYAGNGGGEIGAQGAGGAYSLNCDDLHGFGITGGNGSASWDANNSGEGEGGQGGVGPFGGLAGSGYLDHGIPGVNRTGAGGAGAGANAHNSGASGAGAGGYFRRVYPRGVFNWQVGRGGDPGDPAPEGYLGGRGAQGMLTLLIVPYPSRIYP